MIIKTIKQFKQLVRDGQCIEGFEFNPGQEEISHSFIKKMFEILRHRSCPAGRINLSGRLNAQYVETIANMFKSPSEYPEGLELDLSKNNLGPDEAQKLANVLQFFPYAFELDLSDNQLGEEGARYFSQELIHGPDELRLNLSSNQLGAEGAAVILEPLKSEYPVKLILLLNNNDINIDGAKKIAPILQCADYQFEPLIYLQGNALGTEGVCAITTALASIDSQEGKLGLYLGDNELNAQGIQYVVALLSSAQCPINFIGLSHTRFDDASVKLIATMFQQGQYPADLLIDLSDCRFGSVGVMPILKALSRAELPNIKYCNFNHSVFRSKDVGLLAPLLSANPSIEVMDIRQIHGFKMASDMKAQLLKKIKETIAERGNSCDLYYDETWNTVSVGSRVKRVHSPVLGSSVYKMSQYTSECVTDFFQQVVPQEVKSHPSLYYCVSDKEIVTYIINMAVNSYLAQRRGQMNVKKSLFSFSLYFLREKPDEPLSTLNLPEWVEAQPTAFSALNVLRHHIADEIDSWQASPSLSAILINSFFSRFGAIGKTDSVPKNKSQALEYLDALRHLVRPDADKDYEFATLPRIKC